MVRQRERPTDCFSVAQILFILFILSNLPISLPLLTFT
jgi:hypothetical protein